MEQVLCCPSFTTAAWSSVKAPGILHKPSLQRSAPCSAEKDRKYDVFPGSFWCFQRLWTPPMQGERDCHHLFLFLWLPWVVSYWKCFVLQDLSRVRVGDLQCAFTVWYLLCFGAFPTTPAADEVHSLLPHPFSSFWQGVSAPGCL